MRSVEADQCKEWIKEDAAVGRVRQNGPDLPYLNVLPFNITIIGIWRCKAIIMVVDVCSNTKGQTFFRLT